VVHIDQSIGHLSEYHWTWPLDLDLRHWLVGSGLGKNRWDAAGEVDVAALNAKETRLRLYTHTAYDLTKIVSDIASKIQRRGK